MAVVYQFLRFPPSPSAFSFFLLPFLVFPFPIDDISRNPSKIFPKLCTLPFFFSFPLSPLHSPLFLSLFTVFQPFPPLSVTGALVRSLLMAPLNHSYNLLLPDTRGYLCRASSPPPRFPSSKPLLIRGSRLITSLSLPLSFSVFSYRYNCYLHLSVYIVINWQAEVGR